MHLLILSIIDTALKIVLLAMQNQTPEQRAQSWQWHVDFVEFFKGLFSKIPMEEVGPVAAVQNHPLGTQAPRPARVVSRTGGRPTRRTTTVGRGAHKG